MNQIFNGEELINLPKTPFDLYLSLAKGILTPNKFWNSRFFRLKFFIRTIIMPVSTFRILKMLTEHPIYPIVIFAQPRLPCRIHRPYLSMRLKNKERVNAIIHHYDMQLSFLGTSNLKKHFSSEGLTIAIFTGKENTSFRLQYISTHRLDREGEASIILIDNAGKMLSEITFTMFHSSDNTELIIGGLQGPNYENAQGIVQQATKEFHGLFPKRVALASLIILAQIFGVKKIYAVSNKTHIFRSARYKNRTKHIHSDYNSFWKASGGVELSNGHYMLPCTLTRKKLTDVPSKKRAEYRRRFELLENIEDMILATFHRH